ncbi:response regulator [Actinoallomurus iriomotensis]|uniref:DNA-binding response regulator n=1 Tax=Actinoallomurus iriomotensis TaxID=478107 RepID=A0A9W6SDJ8_9ACTN|nr:response regulator transcription factor [Actinoallomurus iriomotensis]GLY90655.1 DNA-binding response regulator [Actinoallomurus iriomotensis]
MSGADAPVRVVLADDQAAVREGLELLLETLPGIAVAAAAADGDAAVEAVARTEPDVALLDLHMPGCDGIEATRRIRERHPATQVVVLTTYADDDSILGALRAGALGYLTKDAGREEIRHALHAAAHGQAVLDPAVQRRLVAAASRAPRPADSGELTAREIEVLRLLATGGSNRAIARRLFISEATVKTHINHIFAKTRSPDRAAAVRYAYDHGFVRPGETAG